MQGPLELLTAYRALEHTDDVTYILSDELRILRMNGAWGRFARANGGEQLVSDWRRGANVLAAIPESLKPFYLAVFAHARDSQERWEHDYQCSSPEIHRRYRMLVYPFGGTFLVTHSLVVAGPHDDEAHPPAEHYTINGVVTMCSHCRRVRRRSVGETWDWSPAYVAAMPPNVSHGLCPACSSYYYGSLDDR